MVMKRDEWIRAKAWDTAQKDGLSREAYENPATVYKLSYLGDATREWEMMHPPGRKTFLNQLLGWWID